MCISGENIPDSGNSQHKGSEVEWAGSIYGTTRRLELCGVGKKDEV